MQSVKKKIIFIVIILICLSFNTNSSQNKNKTTNIQEIHNDIDTSMTGIVELWNNTWDNNNDDVSRDITVDNLGNVYVTGFTGSFANLDIFITKYSSSGLLLWNKTWGTPVDDISNAITTDLQGNVYITGLNYTFGSTYSGDMVLLKYSSSGEELWMRTWSIGYGECGKDIAVDLNGNIFVTGYIRFSSNPSDMERFLLKFDNNGTIQWEVISNENQRNYGENLAVDSAGNVYVVGGRTPIGRDDDKEIFIVKFDTSGTQLWINKFNRYDSNDNPNGIALDTSGNIYIIGKIENDIIFIKFDNSGRQLWNKIIFNNGDGSEIAITSSNNIYIFVKDNDYRSVFKFNISGDEKWFISMNYNSRIFNHFTVCNSDYLYVTGYLDVGGMNERNMICIKYDNKTIDLPPSKVFNVRIDYKTKNTISLSWNKNPEPDIAFYKIFRNDTLINTTNYNNFIDEGLISDTNYEYQVSAVNKVLLEGENSSKIHIKTYKDIPIEVTGLMEVFRASNEIGISWNDNPESNIDYYNIYRNDELIGKSINSNYNDAGLKPKTEYTYQISAVNDIPQEGLKSKNLIISTRSDIPSKVTGLVIIEKSANEIIISWNKNPEINIIGYNIYRNGILIIYTTNFVYIDRDISPDTTYRYQISAINEWYEVSTLSESIHVTSESVNIHPLSNNLEIIIITSIFIIGITFLLLFTGIVLVSQKRIDHFKSKRDKKEEYYSGVKSSNLKKNKYCENCGARLIEDVKFCGRCGTEDKFLKSSKISKSRLGTKSDQISLIKIHFNSKDSNFNNGRFNFKGTILRKYFTQLLALLTLTLIFIYITPIISSLNLFENLALDFLISLAGVLILFLLLLPFEIYVRSKNYLILNKHKILWKQNRQEVEIYFMDISRIDYITKKDLKKENICRITLKNGKVNELKLNHWLITMERKKRINYLRKLIDSYFQANEIISNSIISLQYESLQLGKRNYIGIIAVISGFIGFFVFGLFLGLISFFMGMVGRYKDKIKKYSSIAILLGILDLIGLAFVLLFL